MLRLTLCRQGSTPWFLDVSLHLIVVMACNNCYSAVISNPIILLTCQFLKCLAFLLVMCLSIVVTKTLLGPTGEGDFVLWREEDGGGRDNHMTQALVPFLTSYICFSSLVGGGLLWLWEFWRMINTVPFPSPCAFSPTRIASLLPKIWQKDSAHMKYSSGKVRDK